MNPDLYTDNETDTTRPATPNSGLMDALSKILVNLFSMSEVIHIAVNLLLQRRPQIERQLDQVTYGDIRRGNFRSVANNIAEAVFCDNVENPTDQRALTLAQQLCVIFLTIEHDKKISIIKEVRYITSRNLKDSKLLVDRVFEHGVFASLPDTFGKADKLAKTLDQREVALEDLRAEFQRVRVQRDDLENALADERESRNRLIKIADARYDQVAGLESLVEFAQDKLNESLVPILKGGRKALEDEFDKASR